MKKNGEATSEEKEKCLMYLNPPDRPGQKCRSNVLFFFALGPASVHELAWLNCLTDLSVTVGGQPRPLMLAK